MRTQRFVIYEPCHTCEALVYNARALRTVLESAMERLSFLEERVLAPHACAEAPTPGIRDALMSQIEDDVLDDDDVPTEDDTDEASDASASDSGDSSDASDASDYDSDLSDATEDEMPRVKTCRAYLVTGARAGVRCPQRCFGDNVICPRHKREGITPTCKFDKCTEPLCNEWAVSDLTGTRCKYHTERKRCKKSSCRRWFDPAHNRRRRLCDACSKI